MVLKSLTSTSALKGLTFTTAPSTTTTTDPVVARRKELIIRLKLQRSLALDPTFKRTVKTKDGEKQFKVMPAWKPAEDGKTLVFVLRVNFKPVEFDKGLTGIAVKSLKDIPAVIDQLVAAIDAGELDDKIRVEKKTAKSRKS